MDIFASLTTNVCSLVSETSNSCSFVFQPLKESSQSNLFTRVWWYRLFLFFEENVNGTVPRSYQLPFSLRVSPWSRKVKYSKLDIQ